MKLMTKDERYKLGDKKEKQALKMLKDTHNCLMVCVTGFGKTYHLINIAKKYDKVYYMVPRIVIKNDIISKYDLSNINIEFICRGGIIWRYGEIYQAMRDCIK